MLGAHIHPGETAQKPQGPFLLDNPRLNVFNGRAHVLFGNMTLHLKINAQPLRFYIVFRA
jgi:hypothetical protein